MAAMRDGSSEAVGNLMSDGLQIPNHTIKRGVTLDPQDKKCFYCRQDRQKCEWEPGHQKCGRCEKMGYTCADHVPATADASRRTLRFEKCSFCRASRQKCLPVDRLWPARCDRCVAKGLACTEPQKKSADNRQRTPSEFGVSVNISSPPPVSEDGPRPEPGQKRQRVESTGTFRAIPPHWGETSQRDFGYTALNTGGFRVLELHRGSPNDDIVCELHQWDGKTKYEAVSYVRSFDAQLRITMLTSKRKALHKTIMPNLHAALRHLRYEDRSRFLWINALCIDHSNTNERNVQVHVVHTIFKQATNVCLWLGEVNGSTDGDTGLAFDFAAGLLDPNFFDGASKDVRCVKKWKALLDLLSHPLFERRWVVQEVAVAGQATIHYGRHTMNWSDFADVVTMFEHAESHNHAITRLFRRSSEFSHDSDVIGDVQALGASRFIQLTSNIFKKWKFESKASDVTENLLSLEDLVCQLASFKGWDPHDVVYACVSLSQESHGSGFAVSEPTPTVRRAANKFLGKLRRRVHSEEKPVILRSGQLNLIENAVSALLRTESSSINSKREVDSFLNQVRHDRTPYNVNYDLPVLSTYKEFIAHVLRSSKSLGILCRPWAPSKQILADYLDGGVPSWIATLDRAAFGKSPTFESYVRINANPLIGNPGKEPYKASLGLPAIWTFPNARSGPNRILCVEGFVLTTISDARTEALQGNIPVKWMQFVNWTLRGGHAGTKMVPGRQAAQEVTSNKDGDGDLPPDSFWRTLVADRGPNGTFAPVFYRRACHYVFKQNTVASVINLEQLLENVSLPMVKEFLQRVQEVVWNRQLIKTERGYLGLAPEAALRGDMVCILYGCSVPVVIRPTANGMHELIGECYIHGMMDGAAVGVQTAQGIPREVFKLQ